MVEEFSYNVFCKPFFWSNTLVGLPILSTCSVQCYLLYSYLIINSCTHTTPNTKRSLCFVKVFYHHSLSCYFRACIYAFSAVRSFVPFEPSHQIYCWHKTVLPSLRTHLVYSYTIQYPTKVLSKFKFVSNSLNFNQLYIKQISRTQFYRKHEKYFSKFLEKVWKNYLLQFFSIQGSLPLIFNCHSILFLVSSTFRIFCSITLGMFLTSLAFVCFSYFSSSLRITHKNNAYQWHLLSCVILLLFLTIFFTSLALQTLWDLASSTSPFIPFYF